MAEVVKVDYSQEIIRELSEQEQNDVKQFLFDSCPDKMKIALSNYLIFEKKAKEEGTLLKNGIRDGIIVKIDLILGRLNTNLVYDEKSQSVKHLRRV